MNAHALASRKNSILLPDHLQHHLHTARQLVEQDTERGVDRRATGIDPLDRLLVGGLPNGQLIELIGRGSSGRFSIALAVLATTTTRGDAAALVDLGNALDPQGATLAGVVLDRLLWARPEHLRSALIAAESILGAGFPLVVLDLGFPPVPGGRGAETAWLRLARAADTHRSTLLVTAPYRVSGTAASVVVRTASARPGWSGRGSSPRLLSVARTRLELQKQRGRACGRAEPLELISMESLPARAPNESPTAQSGASEREYSLARTG